MKLTWNVLFPQGKWSIWSDLLDDFKLSQQTGIISGPIWNDTQIQAAEPSELILVVAFI